MKIFAVAWSISALVLALTASALAQEQAGEYETFGAGDNLAPGESVTYYFGPGAPSGARILSEKLIFDEENNEEGVTFGMVQTGLKRGYERSVIGYGVRCGAPTSREDVIDVDGTPQGVVRVSLDCLSIPETVTVANDTSITIRITSVSSSVGGYLPQSSGGPDGLDERGQEAPSKMPDSGETRAGEPVSEGGMVAVTFRLTLYGDAPDGEKFYFQYLEADDVSKGSTVSLCGYTDPTVPSTSLGGADGDEAHMPCRGNGKTYMWTARNFPAGAKVSYIFYRSNDKLGVLDEFLTGAETQEADGTIAAYYRLSGAATGGGRQEAPPKMPDSGGGGTAGLLPGR